MIIWFIPPMMCSLIWTVIRAIRWFQGVESEIAPVGQDRLVMASICFIVTMALALGILFRRYAHPV